MAVLGFDIGGANLKAATADGAALSVPFALWKAPGQLPEQLAKLLQSFPQIDQLAVTMTGELADCFSTKQEGVQHIVRACVEVAGKRPLHVWHTAGGFVTPERAIEEALGVAASNWHALATWAGRLVPEGSGLLLDVGSTTTDIIPLSNGHPTPSGLTDLGRLETGELLYTGIRRTPVCAVTPSVEFRGRPCPVAAELFATMLDVYLLLGRIPEDPADIQTANGRPTTKEEAADRLVRMLCCDRTEVSPLELIKFATEIATAQLRQLLSAVDQVLARLVSPVRNVIVSGSGSFLASDVVTQHPILRESRTIPLKDFFSPQVAESACAYAIAVLAEESQNWHHR